MTLKEIALMKKAFLESEFGQYAAKEITMMHGQHHEQAEDIDTEPTKKAAHIDRAAGISEVIKFFTADVALLDSGYFNAKEEVKDDTNSA